MPAPPVGSSFVEISAGMNVNVVRYAPTCTTPTTYCSAKQNSLGCTPSIAIDGLPSASAGNGCALLTTNVVAMLIGVYIHSTSGAASTPFHGGFLRVQARSAGTLRTTVAERPACATES